MTAIKNTTLVCDRCEASRAVIIWADDAHWLSFKVETRLGGQIRFGVGALDGDLHAEDDGCHTLGATPPGAEHLCPECSQDLWNWFRVSVPPG